MSIVHQCLMYINAERLNNDVLVSIISYVKHENIDVILVIT